MNELQKRIAALTLAGFMVSSTSGCKDNDKIRYEYNEEIQQEELVGSVVNDELKEYYIVVINNFENKNQFYLTEKKGINKFYEIFTNTEIIDWEFGSSFGEIVEIIGFEQFISAYSTIKEEYQASEIQEIYNKAINNYDNYKDNANVVKKYVKE